MKTTKVKEMMVPIDDYAVVREDATLYEAITALESAQSRVQAGRDMLRAILVSDGNRRIVGKVRQWDVVRGIEPSYEKMGESENASEDLLSSELMKKMLETHGLWRGPFDDICRKGAEIRVKDIMSVPSMDEYVEEDASIEVAIHRLVMGRFQSLLVMREDEIVGVLRLSDVFKEICNRIKSCRI